MRCAHLYLMRIRIHSVCWRYNLFAFSEHRRTHTHASIWSRLFNPKPHLPICVRTSVFACFHIFPIAQHTINSADIIYDVCTHFKGASNKCAPKVIVLYNFFFSIPSHLISIEIEIYYPTNNTLSFFATFPFFFRSSIRDVCIYTGTYYICIIYVLLLWLCVKE